MGGKKKIYHGIFRKHELSTKTKYLSLKLYGSSLVKCLLTVTVLFKSTKGSVIFQDIIILIITTLFMKRVTVCQDAERVIFDLLQIVYFENVKTYF